MSSVGVKELKNRLTYYLRLTKQGEEVVVTERGKPSAMLQPIQTATPTACREAKLAQLVAQGAVTLPTRKFFQRIRRIRVSGTPLSKVVLEDRR